MLEQRRMLLVKPLQPPCCFNNSDVERAFRCGFASLEPVGCKSSSQFPLPAGTLFNAGERIRFNCPDGEFDLLSEPIHLQRARCYP